MSDNPLAGLQIPSVNDIAKRIVDRMGNILIDLSNPLQRHRLREYIEQALGVAINYELEQALHAATDKALTHVFRVMRDEEYQAKKKERRLAAQAKRAKTRDAKDIAEREARMDYSKTAIKPLGPVKGTIQ